MKVQPGVTVEAQTWTEFKEKHDKPSNKIQELMKKNLGKEPEKQSLKPLEKLPITGKQISLLKVLIKKDSFPYSKKQVGQIASSNNIYSRRDHIKNAVKALTKVPEVPVKMVDSKISSADVSCDCGASIDLAVLYKKRECLKCGRKAEFDIK